MKVDAAVPAEADLVRNDRREIGFALSMDDTSDPLYIRMHILGPSTLFMNYATFRGPLLSCPLF
jgi:hypothetical protein